MEILGIGLQELVLIFLVAIIVMGPKDMQKAGKTIGKWLRSVVTSDGWKIFMQTSRELRTLPNRLMREANEELQRAEEEVKRAEQEAKAVIGDPARELAQPARSQPLKQPEVVLPTPPPNPVSKGSESNQDA